MADSILSAVVLAIVSVEAFSSNAIFAYDAYWAFRLRSAVSVGIYRKQATAIGAISLGWILIFVDFVLVGALHYYALFFLVDALNAMLLFYWIDSAVLAAKRLDPLARDTLHWQELRLWLWGLIVAATAVSIGLATYYELVTGGVPQFMYYIIPTQPNQPNPTPNWGAGFLPVLVAVVTGIVALPLAAHRTKDEPLRQSLWWFAAFVVFIIFVPLLDSAPWTLTFLIAGGYSLYRSARALVPHDIAKFTETVS